MEKRVSDVCFLLEGTYPYVSGGVSSWVHQTITSFPDITFSGVVILPEKGKKEYKYPIPPNLLELKEVYLSDGIVKPPFIPSVHSRDFLYFQKMLVALKEGSQDDFAEAIEYISIHKKEFTPEKIIFSWELWQHMQEEYHELFEGMSFLDYFWLWRFMHLGLIQVLHSSIPRARVYHTVCTGYAGFLGAMTKSVNSRPLILTEHGIYTRERQVEISMADWIYEKESRVLSVSRGVGTFRQVWIDFFRRLSNICYQACDEIITLYGGNQRYQLEEGAAPDRMKIIPNGIDVDRMAALIQKNKPRPYTIALAGRVVPVKDIKTFIRAIHQVYSQLPGIEAHVLGNYTEDPDYYQECRDLVRLLNMEKYFFFQGNVEIEEWLPRIHLMVLTSISEGQPLVIMEANAAGIPVVATAVGACSELVLGRDSEDEALGPSGIITGLSDARETANSVLEILTRPKLYKAMANSGIARVSKYYNQEIYREQYRALYEKYIKQETL